MMLGANNFDSNEDSQDVSAQMLKELNTIGDSKSQTSSNDNINKNLNKTRSDIRRNETD